MRLPCPIPTAVRSAAARREASRLAALRPPPTPLERVKAVDAGVHTKTRVVVKRRLIKGAITNILDPKAVESLLLALCPILNARY